VLENFVVIMDSVYHTVGFVMVRMTAKINLMKQIVQVQRLRFIAHVSNGSEIVAEKSIYFIVL
jgi:hypothetical protein